MNTRPCKLKDYYNLPSAFFAQPVVVEDNGCDNRITIVAKETSETGSGEIMNIGYIDRDWSVANADASGMRGFIQALVGRIVQKIITNRSSA